MYPAIQTFYNAIRLTEIPDAGPSGPAPLSHTQVFYKEYPRFERISLPDVRADGHLDALLDKRRSQRDFSDEPLSIEDVAALLMTCRLNREDEERRTYPSGGARYSVEAYLFAFRVRGLEPGCYHYAVRQGALEVLWPANLEEKKEAIVSCYVPNPAASIVFTAVLGRHEVKYGNRAYPYSLIEAGHMAQNMQLAAAARGVGSCPISGFVDTEIQQLLDLTAEEIPIYSLALGKL